MTVFEVFVVGIGACAVFDVWQRIFQRLTAIPPSDWSIVGRWSLGVVIKGKLIARDIESQTKIQHETAIGWMVHYGIAVCYAAVFNILMSSGIVTANVTDGLSFGVISVLIPWFFFFPCLGKGMMARRTSKPLLACFLALMMHSLFGVSIGLGFQFLN